VLVLEGVRQPVVTIVLATLLSVAVLVNLVQAVYFCRRRTAAVDERSQPQILAPEQVAWSKQTSADGPSDGDYTETVIYDDSETGPPVPARMHSESAKSRRSRYAHERR